MNLTAKGKEIKETLLKFFMSLDELIGDLKYVETN
jgi:hypothetical protein